MVCKIASVKDDKRLLKNLEEDVHQNYLEMSWKKSNTTELHGRD